MEQHTCAALRLISARPPIPSWLFSLRRFLGFHGARAIWARGHADAELSTARRVRTHGSTWKRRVLGVHKSYSEVYRPGEQGYAVAVARLHQRRCDSTRWRHSINRRRNTFRVVRGHSCKTWNG